MDTSLPEGALDAEASCPARITPQFSAEVERLSEELIGHIADKWTMIVLEELADHGTMRFSELRRAIPKISQKMLTQTLRQMERCGLVSRKIYPVIPPRVEYQRTALGDSLGPAICALWTWVEDNADGIVAAQAQFDQSQTAKV